MHDAGPAQAGESKALGAGDAESREQPLERARTSANIAAGGDRAADETGAAGTQLTGDPEWLEKLFSKESAYGLIGRGFFESPRRDDGPLPTKELFTGTYESRFREVGGMTIAGVFEHVPETDPLWGEFPGVAAQLLARSSHATLAEVLDIPTGDELADLWFDMRDRYAKSLEPQVICTFLRSYRWQEKDSPDKNILDYAGVDLQRYVDREAALHADPPEFWDHVRDYGEAVIERRAVYGELAQLGSGATEEDKARWRQAQDIEAEREQRVTLKSWHEHVERGLFEDVDDRTGRLSFLNRLSAIKLQVELGIYKDKND